MTTPTSIIMKSIIKDIKDVLNDTIAIYDEPPDWETYYSSEFLYEALKWDFAYNTPPVPGVN